MKILYTGSAGPLSVIPLEYLLDHGQEVCAVVVDSYAARPEGLPSLVEHQGAVESLARFHDIPVVALQEGRRALAAVKALSPDILLCSCFPYRLPQEVLALPALGGYNLHPSLLPAWRGPDPLFWQFRAGIDRFGVSWHRMTEKLDAGAVVAQAPLQMPDGIAGAEAAARAGQAGAGLLSGLLSALSRGTVTELARDERLASYQPLPRQEDFTVSTTWSAHRLYNFICATRDRGSVFPCTIDERVYRLTRAVAWNNEASGAPVIDGRRITFSCKPGRLTADVL